MMARASLSMAWMRGGAPSIRLGRVALTCSWEAHAYQRPANGFLVSEDLVPKGLVWKRMLLL